MLLGLIVSCQVCKLKAVQELLAAILWSYARLWYLAREIGSRPRVAIPIEAIEHAEPADCTVFVENEMNWKPVEGKFVWRLRS
jgi:hypothetical protein